MLNLEQKKEIVAEVADVAANAQSAIAAEYRGLTVDQMTSLRKEARNAGVYLRVVKNTLAKRAVDGTDFDCLKDALVGPLVLFFSQEDPASGARIVRDFSKQSDKLIVKAIVLSGKMMEPSELKRLAEMPTREQAISMLMGVMLAPITKFVCTLAEPNNKLARTFAAVRDQKAG
ncbi:MAG: 50S ribosomal protein L10 [Gammaproteobacteria bacterium]|nr:50S ribosomal protein L10 [Gammaproteobacteria bacterium]